MTTFVSGSIAFDQIKMRWQEPYVSQGLNKKMFGVLPRGVYSGFFVVPSADNDPRHIDITNKVGAGCVSGYCFGAYDTTSGFSIAVHEDLFGNQTTVTGQSQLGQFTLDLTGLDGQSVYCALDVAYLLGQDTQAFVKIVDAAEIAAHPNLTILAKINVPAPFVPITDANIVIDDPTYPRLTPFASRFKHGFMTPDDVRTQARLADVAASDLTGGGQVSWNLGTATVAWTDILNIRIFQRLLTYQIQVGSIALNDQEIAYVVVPDVVSNTNLTVQKVALGSFTFDEHEALHFPLFYRDGDTIYIPHGAELIQPGDILGDLGNQDRGLKLVEGGTWSWTSGTGTLAWSAPAYIDVPQVPRDNNEIFTGSTILAADGDVAYVEFSRLTVGAQVLAVFTDNIATLDPDDSTLIIARREGNDVLIGKSFRLINGQSKKLDAGLSDQNRTFIGATNEADSTPVYSSNNYVANADPLNTATGKLDTRALVQAQIADQNVSMSLESGGTWSWTSGTGALVNSAQASVVVVGVAQNRNQVAAQTILLTADQQAAYVTVNRSGAGAATLTVTVAGIASVPLGDNIFVLAIRDGNEVQVGKGMRLINGESKKLFAGLSDQNAAFIGAVNAADGAPAYTTALGGPTANATVVDGEKLTAAIKRLDGVAGSSTSAANQDRSLHLIKGGTWSWNSGTGVVTWTADATAQVPGIADARNNILAANATLAADGAIAYVEINRAAGAAANLTVLIATISTLVPTTNTLIIARRENNDVLIGDSMRLTGGESKALYEGVSDQVLTYIGDPSNATSSPTYASNNYISNGNSLTTATGKLDTRAAVQAQIAQQNVSARLEGGGTWSWVSGTGTLTITSTAFVVVAGVAQARNKIAAGPFVFSADQQAAYVTVNRANGVAAFLAVTVADIASVPLADDVFVIAIRDGNDIITDKGMRLIDGESKKLFVGVSDQMLTYIGSPSNATSAPAYSTALGGPVANRFVNDGDGLTKAVKELDQNLGLFAVDYACQDRNAKLVRGGTWAWSLTSGLLFDQSAAIQVPGLPESANNIPLSMSPIFLSQDGAIAYVNLNRTAFPQNLSIVTGLASGVSCTSGMYVIARRIGSDVLVGNQSSHLIDGESTEIDQGLSIQTRSLLGTGVTPATSSPNYSGRGSPQRTLDNSQGILDALASVDTQLDKFFGQIRIKTGASVSKVAITGVDFTMKDNSVLSQQQSNFFLDFSGASINFATGAVLASDDVTSLGINFTPLTVPVGQFAWYSLTLIPGTVGVDNRITAQFQILPAATTGATALAAPYPQFVSGKQAGAVLVQNVGGTISVVQIRQMGFGSGGGGSGGDPSFQISTVSSNNARITGGRLLRDDGISLATGSGTTSGTVGTDQLVALDTILGVTVANATTYYLYIDQTTLGAPVILSDTGEKIVNVVQANFKLLTTTPENTNPLRYVYVAWFRTATTGNSFSGTGSGFGSRPTKLIDELTAFFANPQEYATTLSSAATSVLTHGLGGEPQITNFYYVDSSGNKNGVDPQNVLITKSATTITVSTLGYDFASSQSFIVEAFYVPRAQNTIATASHMFVSSWFQNTATTTVPHALSDMDDVRSYEVQEWNVSTNKRRNINRDALVINFDNTNFYLDWTDVVPSATLQYRIVTGGTALPAAVPSQFGGYTKFVGFGPGSYATITAALAAAAPGDSILVLRSYSISAAEVVNVANVKIAFMPGIQITVTGGTRALQVTATGVELRNLYYLVNFAGTLTAGIEWGTTNTYADNCFVEASNAGLTITDAFSILSTNTGNRLHGLGTKATSGTITNRMTDSGSNNSWDVT